MQRSSSGYRIDLFPEPLDPVSQLWAAFSSVSELGDQKRKRFGVARNRKRPGIDRIEADIADQGSGHFVRAPIIAAIDDAWPGGLLARLVNPRQNFARHGVKGGNDAGSRQPAGEFLRARRRAAD